MTEQSERLKLAAQKTQRRAAARLRRLELLGGRDKAAMAVAAFDFEPVMGPQKGGLVVSGFMPQEDEFDVLPLLKRFREEGNRIVLPVVAEKAKPLVFREWTGTEELMPAVMGIPVPPETAAVLEPDLLIVPFLEADRHGYRLGYGGGYYDRTLAALRGSEPVRAVGVGFAGQIVDEVPRDHLDARLDAILTEDGLLQMPFEIAEAAR